jgi:hypothetical protein
MQAARRLASLQPERQCLGSCRTGTFAHRRPFRGRLRPCHRRRSNHAAKGVITDTSLKCPWRPWIERGDKKVDHDLDLRRGCSIWRTNQVYAAQIRGANLEINGIVGSIFSVLAAPESGAEIEQSHFCNRV